MRWSPVTWAGPHAQLAPSADGYVASLVSHANEPLLRRHTQPARLDPRESLPAWGTAVAAMQARGEGLAWGVVDARGEAVGGTTFLDVTLADRRVEIGNIGLGKTVQRTEDYTNVP